MAPPTPTAGELPAVTVVEITEPTAVGAGIEVLDLEAVPLQSEPLRARRVIVRLGSATVVFHYTNLRIRTRTTLGPGLVVYTVFDPRAQGTVNGLPIRPGLMVSVSEGTEVALVVEPGYQSVACLLPPEDIRGQLAARQRDGECRLPQGMEPLAVDPDKARELFDWGKRLADTAARQPELFNDGVRERAVARDEMLEALLATLCDAGDHEPTRDDRTRQARGLVVRKAEDYVLARIDEQVSVGDLCQVTGTSERALQNAFKEVMGLTPVAYLARVRLHRVREALLAGSQATTTVSAEALRWGFWHFGEFSRAYKECFGELPSDTLRRAPGATPPDR